MTKAKAKKKQKFSFHLKGVELLGIKFYHPQKQLPEKITFHFNINIEFRINIDKKFVFVVTSINISDINDKATQLGSIITSCDFEVANLEDFLGKDTKQISFPDEILFTLNSIAISTTRGIMFSQFKGTFLHQACLPLIDPRSFKMNSK